MKGANLQFSREEIDLLCNTSWLLTKNNLLKRIDLFLEELGGGLQAQLSREFPQSMQPLLTPAPKLSRGEQYQGLPYRVLDFPRHFHPQEIFAWRTLFWWGHFFSVTMHLKGSAGQSWGERVLKKLSAVQPFAVRIALSGNEWDHDARQAPLLSSKAPDDWIQQLPQAPFCKLTVLVELDDFENLAEKIRACYQLFSAALTGD